MIAGRTVALGAWVAAIGLAASGCYLAHGDTPPGDDGRPGSAPRDAGDEGTLDAGPVGRDFDAGPVRPRPDAGGVESDEPDFGPGERPSDNPVADDWVPPPPATDDVCCALDEPIEITPPSAQGGVPSVVWADTGWSVLLQSDPEGPSGLYHARVDPDVTRVESFRAVPGGGSRVRAHAWAAGQSAVVANRWRSEESSFGLLDADGALTESWAQVPSERGGSAIARQAYRAMWAVAATRSEGIEVRGFDSTTTDVERYTIESIATEDTVGAAGLGSRVAVVWGAEGRLWLQSLVMGEGPIDARLDLGPGRPSGDSSLRSSAVRDQIATTHLEGARAWLTLANPFERTLVRTDLGEARVADRSVGVVGVDKFGIVGTCIPTGIGPNGGAESGGDGVAFQLVSEDGTLLGGRVQVVDDLLNIGGCAVAFNADAFIVVWWSAGDLEYNSLWARRVRPRLPS